MVEDKSKESAGTNQKLDSKGVMISIIGCLELDIHQIDGGRCRGDEEHLHGRVIQRDKVGQ